MIGLIAIAWFWPKRLTRPLNDDHVTYDVTEDDEGLHYIPRN